MFLVELEAKQAWEQGQESPLPGLPITCPTLDLLNPLASLGGGSIKIFNSFMQHLLIAHLFKARYTLGTQSQPLEAHSRVGEADN